MRSADAREKALGDRVDELTAALHNDEAVTKSAVDHLRGCGAIDVAASQLSYLFDGHSEAYQALFGVSH